MILSQYHIFELDTINIYSATYTNIEQNPWFYLQKSEYRRKPQPNLPNKISDRNPSQPFYAVVYL
jgi:hypothetical protein